MYLSNDSTTCFISSTNDSTRFNQNNEIERTPVYSSSRNTTRRVVEKMTGTIDASFRLGYLEDKNLAPLNDLNLNNF